MRKEAFRTWLATSHSVKATTNRVSRAGRVERSLEVLGLPYQDLDEAYADDRLESVIDALRSMVAKAKQGERPPPPLVQTSKQPDKQILSLMNAIQNYRRFRDEETGAANGSWPALEEMRRVFLERAPDFEDFEQRRGVYWEMERRYKDDMIERARSIAASEFDDARAGHAIYDVLIPQEGPPLRWQTIDAIHREDPTLAPRFDAVLGRLARSREPVVEAIMAAAGELEKLREAGLPNLAAGELLSIVFGVAAATRPDQAAFFKIRKGRKLVERLQEEPLFRGQAVQRQDVEAWLDLLERIFVVMRDEWNWKPRDLLDVQGFAWAVLDESWQAFEDEDEEDVESDPPQLIVEDGPYWFVGAAYGRTDDQFDRFIKDGIWEISEPGARHREQVLSMQAGQRIAIKATFTKKLNLPFDNRGRRVSVMSIKAIGTIKSNPGNGTQIFVDWEKGYQSREWYHYTYQPTIWEVYPDKEMARRLIAFAFHGADQDYDWFLANLSNWKDVAPALEPEEEAVPDRRKRDPQNIILFGPPGTGKTYSTMGEAVRLCLELDPENALLQEESRRDELRKEYERLRLLGQIAFVTFHQSFAYEDFIEGREPKAIQGSAGFELAIRQGLFLRFIRQAAESEEEHVLIIDEINRANVSKVFGELITLIESDKRKGMKHALTLRLPYSQEELSVPANLHIVGTMNTADRSIALLDTALRRRFRFRELMPRPELLDEDVGGIKLRRFLEVLNERIEYLFDREHQIGHAFFMHRDTKAQIDEAVRHNVIPLLAEYFYESWEKVFRVLGEAGDGGGFLKRTRLKPFAGDADEPDGERYRYSVRDSFSLDAYAQLTG